MALKEKFAYAVFVVPNVLAGLALNKPVACGCAALNRLLFCEAGVNKLLLCDVAPNKPPVFCGAVEPNKPDVCGCDAGAPNIPLVFCELKIPPDGTLPACGPLRFAL